MNFPRIFLKLINSDTPAVIRSNYPITRLIADLIVTVLIVAIVTGIHATTLFYYLYPYAFYTICILGCVTGFLGRYFISKLRTPYPWNLFQEPFMESHEHKIFEPKVKNYYNYNYYLFYF